MIDNPGEGGRGKSSIAEETILEMSVFILKLMRSRIVVSTGRDWHGKLHFIKKDHSSSGIVHRVMQPDLKVIKQKIFRGFYSAPGEDNGSLN